MARSSLVLAALAAASVLAGCATSPPTRPERPVLEPSPAPAPQALAPQPPADEADNDPSIQEISRQFQATVPLRVVRVGGRTTVQGLEDFETRHVLFLRLLDHHFLRADHLTGRSRQEVELIFGPGTPTDGTSGQTRRLVWEAGPDRLILDFEGDRVAFVAYVMGQ